MHQSIIGTRYGERIRECLGDKSGVRLGTERATHAEVIQAAEDKYPGNLAGVLWYRLSIASAFLSGQGWSPDEQWGVALGGPGPLPDPSGVAPSVAQALVDLSHVVAHRLDRGLEAIHRDHRSFVLASIGVIDELCWENGAQSTRGEHVDDALSGAYFLLRAPCAS